jgi:hypothetical protein
MRPLPLARRDTTKYPKTPPAPQNRPVENRQIININYHNSRQPISNSLKNNVHKKFIDYLTKIEV